MMFRNNLYTLIVIILLGLFLRLPSINVPLLDQNAWRQTDTASIAKNFYENNFSILYPQVNWGGASSGFAESEFQIYPFIVAILYKFFGFHDWLGRLVSLIFFIFSTVLLYRLTQKIFDDKTALFSILFFMISPLNIQFGRAFMPTSTLVFCSIASIYYFSEWIDDEKWIFFMLSSIATAFAILIKPPSLYLGLPLLYLALKKHQKSTFGQWRLWLFAALVLLPSVWWYNHAHQIFLESQVTFGLWGGGYSKFGNLNYWLNIDFYRTLGSRLLKDILPIGGLIFAFIGIFLKSEKTNYVFFWWGIALSIYILIVAEGHFTHYYYQMPLVPVLCVYAGKGLSYLWDFYFIKFAFFRNRKAWKLVLSALFVLMTVSGLARQQQYLSFKPERLAYGKRVDQLTEKNSLIIFGGWNKGPHLQVKYPPRDPIDFYFSNRKGWEVNLDNWTLQLIEDYKQQGAAYFATFWPMGLDIKPQFAKAIRDKHTLLEATDRWVIYKLN
jgi:4-amino-4-deoxy-L-arabinose transferase-like glycosyltransferase